MITSIFIEGLIIGILVSIPLGPIGVLCIQRTLHQGRRSGLISGLGAATADTTFALIAGLGLTFITNFFETQRIYIMLGGAILLTYLGIRIFFTNTIKQVRQCKLKKTNWFKDFVSIFILTISNPLTIIFFGIVFTGLGLVKSDALEIVILVLGVFAGASLWWFTLSSLVATFRNFFRLRIIFWINKIAGIIIICFGLFAVYNAFYPINTNNISQTKLLKISKSIKNQ